MLDRKRISCYERYAPSRARAPNSGLPDRLQVLAEAERLAGSDDLRIAVLPALAAAQLEAGDASGAERNAQRLLRIAARSREAWNHDDLVHAAHTLLGRVALARGDANGAREHLLASARIQGSGALSSFGPDLTLAQALLAAGDRDAVAAYLELCRAFWK